MTDFRDGRAAARRPADAMKLMILCRPDSRRADRPAGRGTPALPPGWKLENEEEVMSDRADSRVGLDPRHRFVLDLFTRIR